MVYCLCFNLLILLYFIMSIKFVIYYIEIMFIIFHYNLFTFGCFHIRLYLNFCQFLINQNYFIRHYIYYFQFL